MKKLGPFVPAILFYLLIFFVSAQDGAVKLPGHGLDKVAHFIEFSILGFFLSVGFFRTLSLTLRAKVLLVVFTGCALGALDEFHQSRVPERSSDIFDSFADAAGVLVGIVVYLYFAEKRKSTREKKKD
jgi:VanZ family protein